VKTVGVRELKNRLSEYLRQARAGESILVTDRGQVVAELSPPGQGSADPSVPPGLLALARRGLVAIGAGGSPNVYPAIPRSRRHKGRRTAAQLLQDERGDR
jgi:antitoxin (DNA-binding transcriptional repressor) of toxin-antitoxin stability system